MSRQPQKLVEIDIFALKQALREAGFESLEEASIGMFGKSRTYLTNLFRRKECTVFNLDKIAVKMDRHVSEFVQGELYADEDWPEDLD